MTKFSKMRRRTIASLKENLGVAKDITTDPAFEQGYDSFKSMADEMMELGGAAHVYLEQAKVWTVTSTAMAETMAGYFVDSDFAAPTKEFQQASEEVSNVVRKSVACVALEQCLNPLKTFCSERVPEIERRVALRNELRIDYDLYRRRWSDLQSLGASADRPKLELTREKLQRAKSAYENLNAELVKEFASLSASKESLLVNQATALMICTNEFFKQASLVMERATQGLPEGAAKTRTERAIGNYLRSGGPDPAATAKAMRANRDSFKIEGSDNPAASDANAYGQYSAGDKRPKMDAENHAPNPRWSQNPMFSNQQLTARCPAAPLPPAPVLGGSKKVVAIARYKYDPQESGEIGFAVGDLIEVLEQGDSGWWIGVAKGKRGEFPANYVQLR